MNARNFITNDKTCKLFSGKRLLCILLFLIHISCVNLTFAVALSGTYLVGTGQTYTTIPAAITALNTNGVSGPVIFSLTDATYSFANSAAPNGTINAITGASSTNTITFKPAVGISPVITITANATQTWGFNLNGADYIIFDGSNTTTYTGSRNMTIIIAGREGYGFYLKSAASHNTIKNCIIKGYSSSSTNSTKNKGIYFSTDANNDYNTLNNNEIYKFYDGIYIEGNSGTLNTTNTISSNKIGESSSSTNYIFRAGIICLYQTICTITKNEVFNIISSAAVDGIELDYSTNSTISRNNVHDIVETSTGLIAGIYCDISGYANPNITISNNMVCHMAGTGGSSFLTSINGIIVYNSGGTPTTTGLYIYFNSIYLPADATYGLGANNAVAAGFSIWGVTGADFRNNIIRVSLGERAAYTGTIGYAVTNSNCGNSFGTINYNQYYVSGQDNNYVGYKVTAGCVSSSVAIAAWRTYTGGEANSTESTVPDFISTSNLHINSTYVSGVDIAGLTIDLDGNTRSSPAKIGADDNGSAPVPLPIELTNFYGEKDREDNILFWTTSSEKNCDYFTIEKTIDGQNFEFVGSIDSHFNNKINSINNYKLYDYNVKNVINYYRLLDIDLDGNITYSSLISIDNRQINDAKKIIKITNILGQEISESSNGLIIYLYSDGTILKKYN